MRLRGFERNNARIVCAFLLCVLFFTVIMSCVPLASDDVVFANIRVHDLSDVLRYVLYYGNGRLLGNLGGVLLSKIPLLGIAVKALLLSGVIFLVPAVLDIRDLTGYLLSFLLFVTIRQALFGQVYTWTSGLINYLPPIWTMLVILLLMKRFDMRPSGKRALLCGGIFLLGFAGQLFVEHCSLMNVLMAGCFVYFRGKNRRRAAPAVWWLVASVLGLAVMLAIPKVFYMEGNRTEGYRGVDVPGLFQLSRSCVAVFVKMGAAFPPVGAMAASGCAAAAVWATRDQRSGKANSFLYICCSCIIAYFFVNEFVLRNMWFVRFENVRKGITACFTALSFLLWIVAIRRLEDRGARNRIWFLLAMALCSLQPFVVVSPSPARTLFFAYVCCVAAVLEFYRYIQSKMGERLSAWLLRTVKVTSVTAGVLLILIFSNIAWLSNLREVHIRQELEEGKQKIVIFEDPYGYVHWSGVNCYARSLYYEEPFDIQFTATDFETWYEQIWLKKNSP